MGEKLDSYDIPVIDAPVSSSAGKRRSIIEAARAEFLAEGYAAASMDTIATRARVSKPTVYKHYGSKERLFLAVISGTLREAYAHLEAIPCSIAESPLAPALRGFLTRWAGTLLSDELTALRRLVIGEIDRFPQLGRLWYEITDDLLNKPLEREMSILHERGTLVVPDRQLAVRQLVALTLGVPELIRTMRRDEVPGDREVADTIAAGVEVYLSHYRAG